MTCIFCHRRIWLWWERLMGRWIMFGAACRFEPGMQFYGPGPAHAACWNDVHRWRPARSAWWR